MPRRTAEDVSRQPDPRLERDLPVRSAGHDLRGRLAELPSSPPSGAGYDADRRLHAAGSPARRESPAMGELERVGPGVVDERASRFQPRERKVADFLASEGRSVVAIHDGYGREGRKPIPLRTGYPYVADIRDTERDLARQQQAASAIFAAIKADGRLKAVYVDDMQHVLDTTESDSRPIG
jgi:hypothetical protein